MTQEVKLKRSQCNYRAENARFLLECDFSKQYCFYYRKRLEKTRPFLEYNARCKWADQSIPIYGLEGLAAIINPNPSGLSPNSIQKSSSPPKTPSSNTNSLNASNYEFTKRIRRHSESSPLPSTSTQQDTSIKPKIELFQSPILPVSTTIALSEVLESPRTPTRKYDETERRQQQQQQSADCIIMGTIFKRMKLQPDVIDELSRGDYHIKCERYAGHYTSSDDTLVLEDTDETISLIGNIDHKKFVTGIVVALLGVPANDGSQFLVRDICYAEPNRLILYNDTLTEENGPIERPLKLVDAEPIYLMVISGLGFHQSMDKGSALIKAMQDVIDFIWGGSKYSEDERSSKVTRILVLGNSLSEDRLAEDELTSSQKDDLKTRMKQSRQVKQYSSSIQAVKHMDNFFAQLSKTIDVDVMPGPSDPSSHLLPQQPFHPCMFPKSCMFPTFNCTTNPHHAIYNDNVEILATSGQNIDIISKFSALSDPIDIMKHHLMWGNSAPSAPDNLYSVPYEDEDPYVIDFIPDIYIAGCQDSYKTEWYNYATMESYISNMNCDNEQESDEVIQEESGEVMLFAQPNIQRKTLLNERSLDSQKSTNNIESDSGSRKETSSTTQTNEWKSSRKSSTLLVTVPNFCDTLTCVLINLKNLESHPLSFK